MLGHARVKDARENPDLVAQLASPEVQNKVERLVFIEIVRLLPHCFNPHSLNPELFCALALTLFAQRIGRTGGDKSKRSEVRFDLPRPRTQAISARPATPPNMPLH